MAQDCTVLNLPPLNCRSRVSRTRRRRPAPPEPCQATSQMPVELSANTSPFTLRTTSILQHPRQRTSGISITVRRWTMTRRSLTPRLRVPRHSRLSRFHHRTSVPTVSIRNSETISVLNKPISRATTASTPTIDPTPLYQTPPTLGKKLSRCRLVARPRSKQQHPLVRIAPVATVAIFADAPSPTSTA